MRSKRNKKKTGGERAPNTERALTSGCAVQPGRDSELSVPPLRYGTALCRLWMTCFQTGRMSELVRNKVNGQAARSVGYL